METTNEPAPRNALEVIERAIQALPTYRPVTGAMALDVALVEGAVCAAMRGLIALDRPPVARGHLRAVPDVVFTGEGGRKLAAILDRLHGALRATQEVRRQMVPAAGPEAAPGPPAA